MAQPLYFLPGVRDAQLKSAPQVRALLAERGLTEVFADVPFDQLAGHELKGRGPGGKAGAILYYQRPDGEVPQQLGYKASEQTWTPAGDGSQYWLGIDPERPPLPEDLARRRQYGGYQIELADGRKWLVPIVRRPDGSTELPTDLKWDATGTLLEPIKPAYLAYWEESAEVLAWLLPDEGTDPRGLPLARCLELAVRALSLNYRFGRHEQNVLAPIDKLNILTLLGVTVDMPRALELIDAQKKTSDGQSTPDSGPGQPDEIPTTDPAAASSK